jgi:hypothetical protein
MASSCATVYSMLKSCDPVNKALEVSYRGGYIYISRSRKQILIIFDNAYPIINLELLTKSQADISITSELWLLQADAQTPHFIIYNHTGRCRPSSDPTFSCFTKVGKSSTSQRILYECTI